MEAEMSDRQYTERISELEAELHRLRIDNHAKAAACAAMRAALAEASRADAWVDRRDALPDQSRQCMFFTNHLDGFIWIGRRGLLPNDVSHWRYLPDPPVIEKTAPASTEET
jgi:hypothetical protein